MKMKLPDLSGKVIVIKSDQEEARKCYENSLKTKRGVFMVYERPPCADTTMIEATPVAPTPNEAVPARATSETDGPPCADTTMIEATPAAPTPNEAVPARATPETDAHMEEGPDDAVPVEEAAPAEDSWEQPAANAVEREIGGKTFKLGSLLSQKNRKG